MAKNRTILRRAEMIRSVLNRYDPADLIASAAPNDEYDPEMNGVLTAIEQASDSHNLADRIERVFSQQFGGASGPFNRWRELANELWRMSRSGQW